MARFFFGIFIAPGGSVRFGMTVTNIFNPSGDWGPRFAMGHPRNPAGELLSTAHGKVLNPAGSFTYRTTVTNIGPLATLADLDF